MSRNLAGLLLVALLAAAGAPEAAAGPPLPSPKPGRGGKAAAGAPLPWANPRRGGKSVHSIVVPAQLTQVHAKATSPRLARGGWT